MSRWISPPPSLMYNTTPQWWSMPFPILQGAANETEQATQAPIKLVMHCAINAVFAATQGLIDFQRPDGGSAPVSNISLIIGESGERKSAVDACFFREHFKFRERQTRNAEVEDIDHRIRLNIWRRQGKLLTRQFGPRLHNDEAELAEAISVLRQHALKEPAPPQRATFLYQDTSIAGLKFGLSRFPVACVHSTEGMSILDGALFKEMTLLCELYSGETHYYDRYGKSIALRKRRLCVSAHAQPERTLRFLQKNGDDFRDSGLAARMTVCLLQSTQGQRKYDAIQVPTTERTRFNDRIRELLEDCATVATQPDIERRQLCLSLNATREYLDFANWVEGQMNGGGRYANCRDYANRLPEKVGRLAAALHFFEGFEGDISLETYSSARAVYEEESKDFLFLFDYVPSEEFLADKLFAWLSQRAQKLGTSTIEKSYLLGYAPARLRKRDVLDPILDILMRQGRIQLHTVGRTTYISPGPTAAIGARQLLA